MFQESVNETGVYGGFTAGLGFNKVKVTTVQPIDDGGGNGDGEGDGEGEFSASKGKSSAPPNSGGGSVSRTEQKIQPFLELLVGYKIQKNLGIEAFYRIIPKFDGVDTSVFGVRAGFKF